MKKILLALLGVIVIVIAAAIVVPFLLPTDTYKQQIEAQVERVTGRELVIAGPLDISLLPTAAVSAEDVRFANVEGGAAADMVQLKSLQAELKIWPLLRGVVEVDRFVLIEPEFHLEIDAEGRPNWALGAPRDEEAATETPPPDEATSETEAPPEAGGGMRLPVTEVRLGDIRIEDGTLTFADARSGAKERIEAINLDLDLPDLQSRLEANGSLGYKGETVKLALAVERPLDLIEGGSSPVRVNGEAPDLTLTFDGAVANAAMPSATGTVELNVTSIRDLAAWLAEPIAFEGEGLRTLRIAGKLAGSPTAVAFDDATVALDAIEGQGNVAVDLSGAVPRLTGRLDLGAVDLNPYLPPETGDGDQADGGREQAGGEAERAEGDWSDEPIAVPPIGGAEVDFELAVDSLRMRDLQLDRSVVAVRLEGPRLSADLSEIALYGGHGSGQLGLEIADGAPQISTQFRLEGLNARAFLTDAADFERLEGTASADLSLSTQGRSQRELVQNLNGEGQATFVDGAIVGINLAEMVRNVASAFQGGGGGERKTDFAELSGTFEVNNGILTNDDLWLQAPVLRVAGSGRLDLPRRTVDYRVEPKAASTLKGQSGERDVAGLLVPVIVRGPWDDLSFTPDLGDLARRALEDPEAVREQIEQLGDVGDDVRDAIKEGGAEKALEGLLGRGGGGGESQGGEGGEQQGDPARQLLKGLFGN
ncbi:MAG: AsmA family protein [Geminicoccaceae bacterium]